MNENETAVAAPMTEPQKQWINDLKTVLDAALAANTSDAYAMLVTKQIDERLEISPEPI